MQIFFFIHDRSYRDRTGKMRSFYEAIRPMVQLIVFITIGSIWVFFSPINVVETYPRILYFFTGTVFSNICVSINFLPLKFLIFSNISILLIYEYILWRLVPSNCFPDVLHAVWNIQLATIFIYTSANC